MRFTCLFLLLFSCLTGFGQQYRFHQYRVEQGLPSDVIKAVTQDTLGFFWIATDDGLVKYDGQKFSSYKNALRSQFVKGFLHTREGRLLAFGDLDIIEIQNQVDTVIFKNVLKGERYFSDSAIWFPKAMYEDMRSTIWVAEPQSLVRIDGKKIKRYDLGEENRSPVFVRSFSFFEDRNSVLYAVSYNGNVFRYNLKADTFARVRGLTFPDHVSNVLLLENRLLIAARDGLFVSTFAMGQFNQPQNIFPVQHVSNLLLSPDSSVIVSTYDQDLYSIQFNPDFVWENYYYNFNGINSTYISKENDVWAATDKGVVLVQKNIFVSGDLNSQTHFVEDIAHDPASNTIYYCSKETLIQLNQKEDGEWKRNVLFEGKDNYFQSLQFGDNKLWASSSWKIFLFQSDRLMRTWDFSSDGNFVHDLFLDKENNLWISQAGTPEVKMLSDSFELKRFNVENLERNEIHLIREGKSGMYGIASGHLSYLYLKKHSEDTFKNISLPLPFLIRGDFDVQDVAIDKNDILWLATTEGLIRYDHNTVKRVSFGEVFEEYPVSSVEILDDENILFSNSFGLFRYNTSNNEYWLYDESTGLPSNTITDHGIFVSEKGEVWIGTSYGIAYATRSLNENKITNKPYCVEARVNGTSTRYSRGVQGPYEAFITMRFSPISFPENKIHLQWKFDNEEGWKSLERDQLTLSNLKDGEYKILVRAKKNTGFSWSAPTAVPLSIHPPYWKKAEFVSAVILLIALIVWATYASSSYIMSRRKKFLEEQINERTMELQKANEELTQRNAELDRFVYSASHDLSAPLKSILGLIMVAKMDKPGDMHVEYLSMMERSVNKLEAFIQEVVSYSRNTRMPVNYDRFYFKPFLEGLLQDHEYSANFRHIQFIIVDELPGPMISDVTRMKIILNNLLSNAIKFHWIENGRQPFIKTSVKQEKDEYILTVEDNGKGIGEEHLQRIFEMFYRATDEAQGSGLGLYILKESVLKLGGKVKAYSKVEQGTRFVINLPIPQLHTD